MSPGDDDRRLPVGERRIGERLAGHAQDDIGRRQSAPRHVLAESHVVAGRVRSRLLLLVVCECGARHVHYGPLGMVAGVRQAACGRRYTLHTGYELARVVA